MTYSKESLDDLKVNFNYQRQEGDRSLTRNEVMLLGWLISKSEGRSYRQIMEECKLSISQIDATIEGLIDIGLLLP